MPAVVQESIDLIQPILAQRTLTLEVTVPQSAALQGDAQRLVQVFVNLLIERREILAGRQHHSHRRGERRCRGGAVGRG